MITRILYAVILILFCFQAYATNDVCDSAAVAFIEEIHEKHVRQVAIAKRDRNTQKIVDKASQTRRYVKTKTTSWRATSWFKEKYMQVMRNLNRHYKETVMYLDNDLVPMASFFARVNKDNKEIYSLGGREARLGSQRKLKPEKTKSVPDPDGGEPKIEVEIPSEMDMFETALAGVRTRLDICQNVVRDRTSAMVNFASSNYNYLEVQKQLKKNKLPIRISRTQVISEPGTTPYLKFIPPVEYKDKLKLKGLMQDVKNNFFDDLEATKEVEYDFAKAMRELGVFAHHLDKQGQRLGEAGLPEPQRSIYAEIQAVLDGVKPVDWAQQSLAREERRAEAQAVRKTFWSYNALMKERAGKVLLFTDSLWPKELKSLGFVNLKDYVGLAKRTKLGGALILASSGGLWSTKSLILQIKNMFFYEEGNLDRCEQQSMEKRALFRKKNKTKLDYRLIYDHDCLHELFSGRYPKRWMRIVNGNIMPGPGFDEDFKAKLPEEYAFYMKKMAEYKKRLFTSFSVLDQETKWQLRMLNERLDKDNFKK
ncbi:MAG: hypothetical protein ISR65_03510 [Bacteriovoracaceae bacterium]|nr:hypothetical protein [Bacteriovoracaceae bacterium]